MAGIIKLVVDNAGKDQDPNFDLRKQLIANLGDDIVTYQKAPRANTLADLNSPPSLLLIGSPRAQELASALKALTSLMPKQTGRVKDREFLGRTLYTLPLPSAPTAEGKPVAKNLTYVASGGYVALSTDAGMVEEFLRGNPDSTLLEMPGLKEAAQKAGGMTTGLFSYENDRENMRSAFAILKKEAATLDNLFGGSALVERFSLDGQTVKFKDWVDFSLLPSFEQVAKFFYYSVYSLKLDKQGFTLTAFSPLSPELR